MTEPMVHFVVEQQLTAFVNRYKVIDEGGTAFAFCEQKRMAMKEDLRFFSDEGRTQDVFRIRARQVIDIGGRYDVTDPAGAPIGALERRAKQSLLRTTWAILDADGRELLWLQESSMAIALLRRAQNVLQMLPLGGVLLDLIPIPFHFDAFDATTPAGRITRVRGLRDRYAVDLPKRLDWRLAVAVSVGLDALQSR